MAGVKEVCEGEAEHEIWRGPRSRNTLYLLEGVECSLWIIGNH